MKETEKINTKVSKINLSQKSNTNHFNHVHINAIQWISWFLLILVFVLLGTSSFLLFSSSNTEMPLGIKIYSLFDKPSPANWVKESQISVYKDKIVISVPDAKISRYTPTKSMDPTLDSSANGIEIKPESPKQIHVGDIIAYQPKNENELIVHRVIKTGIDSQGWYCITKGDNANKADGKIRFENIRYVTIAIIY